MTTSKDVSVWDGSQWVPLAYAVQAGPTGPAGPSGTSAGTSIFTSVSMANNAYQSSTITIAKSYAVSKVQTDVAARVRLYADTTTRDADANRAIGDPLYGDHGLYMDVVTTAGHLTWFVTPAAIGRAATSAVPITVTNLSGGTSVVTVTLTTLNLES